MQKSYNGLELPRDGAAIEYNNGQYQVPDNPIIPFIEGDGTGRDIWKASQRVFDAAVEKAYGGKRSHQVVRDLCRREGLSPVQHMAAR
jgi:isocitrate dehydrogenase